MIFLFSLAALLAGLSGLFVPKEALAQYTPSRDKIENATAPKAPEHVGVKEKLNSPLPRDLSFYDQEGRQVLFGDLFQTKKPAVFVFAYHNCPMLCSLVLDATITGLKNISSHIGVDYNLMVLSIDPNETQDRASRKRAELISKYGRAGSESGFIFLHGIKENIDKIADASGVEYTYDEASKQFGHPAVVMLLTPGANVARYLYGLDYSPNDLRVGLLEASKGRSISTFDQVILYCYQFDPTQSKYVLIARNVMKLGGALTAFLLGVFLLSFWLKERRHKNRSDQSTLAVDELKLEPDFGGQSFGLNKNEIKTILRTTPDKSN